MNKERKKLLVAAMAVSIFAAIFLWAPGVVGNPDATIWCFRIMCPLLGVTCLGTVVWAQNLKDKAPDFLVRVARRYLEKDGFCFTIVPRLSSEGCKMDIFFQNRYSKECKAKLVFRAPSKIFKGKPDLSTVTLEISCQPAAFGKSTLSWSIPDGTQGKLISLRLYADVTYPNGKGVLLRFHDGLGVGPAGIDFKSAWLHIPLALVGLHSISAPAKITFRLPEDVSASSENEIRADTETLWKLGDPVS